MCHKGGLHTLSFVAYLLSAIAAISLGLKALLGYSLIEKIASFVPESIIMHSTLVMILSYIIGIAGLISLYMAFMYCMSKDHCAPNNPYQR